MAEIIPGENQGNKRPGIGKTKKHSLRIDMTPMVDLGFLLITFFIFTSKMSEPTIMKLMMPKEGPDMPTKQSGALTILPADNNTVYYYEGFFETSNLKKTSFKGIRDIIVAKKQRTPAKDFFVIIKPSRLTNYKSVVDILDEMVISDVKSYSLVKITEQEQATLPSLENIRTY